LNLFISVHCLDVTACLFSLVTAAMSDCCF